MYEVVIPETEYPQEAKSVYPGRPVWIAESTNDWFSHETAYTLIIAKLCPWFTGSFTCIFTFRRCGATPFRRICIFRQRSESAPNFLEINPQCKTEPHPTYENYASHYLVNICAKSQNISTNESVIIVQLLIWKHCHKRRHFSLWAISSFVKIFWKLFCKKASASGKGKMTVWQTGTQVIKFLGSVFLRYSSNKSSYVGQCFCVSH